MIRIGQIASTSTGRIVLTQGGRLSEGTQTAMRIPSFAAGSLPPGAADGSLFYDTTAGTLSVVLNGAAQPVPVDDPGYGTWWFTTVEDVPWTGSPYVVGFNQTTVNPVGITYDSTSRTFTIQKAGTWLLCFRLSPWWSSNGPGPDPAVFALELTVNGTTVARGEDAIPATSHGYSDNVYLNLVCLWIGSLNTGAQVKGLGYLVAGTPPSNVRWSNFRSFTAWRIR